MLTCITEQKQVFEGAAHPFYWKPKLRIPDIYENEGNKQAFGQFLKNCLNAKTEDQLIKESLNTVKLIGVLQFQKGTNNVIAAFEVEKSTSIYSGILRSVDLSYTIADGDEVFYLIKGKKMCVYNCAVLQLSKIMSLSNIFFFQIYAVIAMHYASLGKATILWIKSQNLYNSPLYMAFISPH